LLLPLVVHALLIKEAYSSWNVLIPMPHTCVIFTILWYPTLAKHSYISIHVLVSHLQAAADQVVKLRLAVNNVNKEE
jgi:hypothetical protein